MQNQKVKASLWKPWIPNPNQSKLVLKGSTVEKSQAEAWQAAV